MRKAKTYFEMVPVAIAKQVAQAASGSAASPALCVICGTPVRLEHCKIDENGAAVHDRCYIAKLASTTPIKVVPIPRVRS